MPDHRLEGKPHRQARQVIRAARDMATIARESQHLEAELHALARAQVREQIRVATTEALRAMPVEALRAYGPGGLRIRALRQAGITNVAQVLSLSPNQLAMLQGLGPQTAAGLRAAAEAAHSTAQGSVTVTLLPGTEGAPLLDSLVRIAHLARVEHLLRALDIAGSVAPQLPLAGPAGSRVRWALASRSRRARALRTVDTLTRLMADPRVPILLREWSRATGHVTTTGGAAPAPSPDEIGAALTAALGTPGAAPGRGFATTSSQPPTPASARQAGTSAARGRRSEPRPASGPTSSRAVGSDVAAPLDSLVVADAAPHGRLDLGDSEEPEIPPVAARGARAASPPVDRVQVAVFCPARVLTGRDFVLDVWAFLPDDRREALDLASQDGRLQRRGQNMGVRVARGSRIDVRVHLPGATVDPDIETLWWDGGIDSVSFIISAPASWQPGVHTGRVELLRDGLRIGQVPFSVEVTAHAADGSVSRSLRSGGASMHRTAFASYASADVDRVMARVQGIHASGVDVFVDRLNLAPGDSWRDVLEENIRDRDVFYLFWSSAARASAEVTREWRLALEAKGLQGIHPVPLDPPSLCPPPAELSSLHFNDRYLQAL